MSILKKLTFLALLFVGVSLFAQSTPPNPNPPPPGLPIDGFLGLAGLLAISLGVYVIARRNYVAISRTKTINNNPKK